MTAKIHTWDKPAYRRFLSPEEQRAQREAEKRGDVAKVIEIKHEDKNEDPRQERSG